MYGEDLVNLSYMLHIQKQFLLQIPVVHLFRRKANFIYNIYTSLCAQLCITLVNSFGAFSLQTL